MIQNNTIAARQQRLENNIKRNRIAGFLKEAQKEAESGGMAAESKLINDLIDFLHQSDSPTYRRLRKNLKLRQLRII